MSFGIQAVRVFRASPAPDTMAGAFRDAAFRDAANYCSRSFKKSSILPFASAAASGW